MGLYDNFPYTNKHELNLDWILKELSGFQGDLNEIKALFTDELREAVDTYVAENLSQFILGAIYDPENTAIKLQQAVVVGDSDHFYNAQQEQIIVLEGR